jgi:CRISPR-associated protein Csy3
MTMALRTASVLAFEKKLSTSDALMFAGNWQDRDQEDSWLPIRINSKDVRGTISNRLKAGIKNDPAKLDAEIQKPNLQRVDVAALPFGTDTLRVNFTLRVLGNLKQPSACNDQDYQAALAKIVDEYSENIGFKTLAARYAANIANGRFLWRNRIGLEKIEVRVSHIVNEQVANEWQFDAGKYSLRNFDENREGLSALAQVIHEGLAGEGFTFLDIKAFACIGSGQEVFPSQELVLDNSRNNKKSKTLYQVEDVAAIHSQKIGNALRTIDTWYPEAEKLGPIAVEPYGAVTNRGKAYRQPKDKMDFYTLLDNWLIKEKVPPVEQQHYVMATLIRGGVFGEKAD